MKQLSLISRIFLILAAISGSLWFGAYLCRLFVTYQLFEPEDLVLKGYISNLNLGGILYTLLPAITTTFVLYIIFILTYVIFLISSRISLKKYGWLFIVTLIILLTMPLEVYLMSIDYKLLVMLNSAGFNPASAEALIRDRVQALSSFPLVEIFCYMSIFYFVLFRPLQQKENELT